MVAEPPVTADAFDSAHSVLRVCIDRPWRRLCSAVRKTDATSPEQMWHRVRIRAKQARYAAEAVAPILGPDYTRLARQLAKATDTLGVRQDAAVSAQWLSELADSAPPSVAFSLGIMAAGCGEEGLDFQRDFTRRWPSVRARAHALGLE